MYISDGGAGNARVSDVGVAETMVLDMVRSCTEVPDGDGSNPVPLMTSDVAKLTRGAWLGVMLTTVPTATSTGAPLVPFHAVMTAVSGPALNGAPRPPKVTVNEVEVADAIVAVPLDNVTRLPAADGLKPVPEMLNVLADVASRADDCVTET